MIRSSPVALTCKRERKMTFGFILYFLEAPPCRFLFCWRERVRAHVQEVVSALLDCAQVLHQVLGAHNTAASQQLLQPHARTPTARPQCLPSATIHSPSDAGSTYQSISVCQDPLQ